MMSGLGAEVISERSDRCAYQSRVYLLRDTNLTRNSGMPCFEKEKIVNLCFGKSKKRKLR